MKGLVIALQKKIAELEKENEELKERLDGEVGYFYEAMDYNTLAELANRQEKQLAKADCVIEELQCDNYCELGGCQRCTYLYGENYLEEKEEDNVN